LKAIFHNVLLMIGISALILYPMSCERNSDGRNYYTLEPISDARTLPYQFAIKQKLLFNSDLGQIYQEERVPLDLYNDEIVRMYAVQSGWNSDSGLTSIIFYDGTNAVRAITQRNIEASNISSHLPCDLDGDLIFTNLVDGNNIWMTELRSCPCFTLEPLPVY